MKTHSNQSVSHYECSCSYCTHFKWDFSIFAFYKKNCHLWSASVIVLYKARGCLDSYQHLSESSKVCMAFPSVGQKSDSMRPRVQAQECPRSQALNMATSKPWGDSNRGEGLWEPWAAARQCLPLLQLRPSQICRPAKNNGLRNLKLNPWSTVTIWIPD